MRLQHLQALGGDRVAHGHATAIPAMKLEALHQSGIREALEATLGGRRRAPRVDPSMNLTTQDVPQTGDQAQYLEVGGVRFVGMRRSGWPRSAHRLSAIELDQVSIALDNCLRERWRYGEKLGLRGRQRECELAVYPLPVRLTKVA